MTAVTFTHAAADAALCIWESALDDYQAAYIWLCQGEGACTGRDNALLIAEHCESAWKKAESLGYDGSFDWDFVPRFLAKVIERCETPGTINANIACQTGEAIFIDD